MNGQREWSQPRVGLAAAGGDQFVSKLREWRWDEKLAAPAAAPVASRRCPRSHDGFWELFMFWNERGRRGVGGCAGVRPQPSSTFYEHVNKGTRRNKATHGSLQSTHHRGEDTAHPRREAGD